MRDSSKQPFSIVGVNNNSLSHREGFWNLYVNIRHTWRKAVALIFSEVGGKGMRLDKYLKVSRLIKRRTVANDACDAGRVLINDRPAKASANVKVGDIIEIGFGSKAVRIEVLDVQETTRKDDAKELYKYL